jgi:hypothetical protein
VAGELSGEGMSRETTASPFITGFFIFQ